MRSIASLDSESFISFARMRASSARARQWSGSLMKWLTIPPPPSVVSFLQRSRKSALQCGCAKKFGERCKNLTDLRKGGAIGSNERHKAPHFLVPSSISHYQKGGPPVVAAYTRGPVKRIGGLPYVRCIQFYVTDRRFSSCYHTYTT